MNFTRAAEKCNVAQPALTRAIKLLEDEFGGLLLHRERARTHLSELGQAVRSYLEEVLRQSQQAKRLATSFIELKGTPLKLGIMCSIGPSNFVGLLTSLQAQYPGIELQIMDAVASDLQGRLLDGGLEAAIYAGRTRSTSGFTIFRSSASNSSSCSVASTGWPTDPKSASVTSNGERYLKRINCEQANVARDVFAQHGTKVERVYRATATTGFLPWSRPASASPSCRNIPSRSARISWCGH